MKTKRLNTGDAAVAVNPDILYTSGIGSCVVICLWDPKNLIGGMAHVPLPESKDRFSREWFSNGVSPDVAFPFLLKKMADMGSVQSNLTLRLVGGGNMFSSIEAYCDVGKLILEKTKEISGSLGIPMLKGCTGGIYGKSCEFNVESGLIIVNHTNGFSETL